MIRTLLVDDENIVRKGLLHILPWKDHGLEVVADLPGGEQALEWMNREQVDLLVTDLSMPGMSGFELIRTVKEQHPHTQTVILTCHQDFQYVQDALRLGAIDYIVKTELDDNKMDQLFGRISEKISAGKAKDGKRHSGEAAPGLTGVLFLGLYADCTANELLAVPWMAEKIPTAITDHSWYVEKPEGIFNGSFTVDDAALQEMPKQLENRWAIIILHHSHMLLDRARLRPLLTSYVKRHAFYVMKLHDSPVVIHESMRDLQKREEAGRQDDWIHCWLSFEWLNWEASFAELLKTIAEERPEPVSLCQTLYTSIRCWKRLKRLSATGAWLQESERFRTWSEWQDGLNRLREMVKLTLEDNGIAGDMTIRVLQSVEWTSRHLGEGITQEDVAASVHLSRGYFSECFKKIAGANFHEFMRELRMDQAKELLKNEHVTILEVTEKCGFADEPYFRKLFRKETGMTPKEYRDRSRNRPAPEFVHWMTDNP